MVFTNDPRDILGQHKCMQWSKVLKWSSTWTFWLLPTLAHGGVVIVDQDDMHTTKVTVSHVYSLNRDRKMVQSPPKHRRLYPVVSADPVEHAQSFPETNYVCRCETVPVYRNTSSTSIFHQNNAKSGVGVLVGAAIGGAIAHKADLLAGVIIGGAIGHSLMGRQLVVETTVQDGFTKVVGYRDIKTCKLINGSYEKNVIIGYNIRYIDNGVIKMITTANYPGAYIELE